MSKARCNKTQCKTHQRIQASLNWWFLVVFTATWFPLFHTHFWTAGSPSSRTAEGQGACLDASSFSTKTPKRMPFGVLGCFKYLSTFKRHPFGSPGMLKNTTWLGSNFSMLFLLISLNFHVASNRNTWTGTNC